MNYYHLDAQGREIGSVLIDALRAPRATGLAARGLPLPSLFPIGPVFSCRVGCRIQIDATFCRRFHRLRGVLVVLACLSGIGALRGAEVIPSRPARYFNDAAGIVPGNFADQLNRQLEQFERETSNQILVAIYPRLQSDSSVEDYTVRVAQAWGVGQKGRNNGAVLFAFMQEHQLRIQVGYGLERALPDGVCHLIIENELKPRFRAGDYAGGLSAAVTAIIAATRDEYPSPPSSSEKQNNMTSITTSGIVLAQQTRPASSGALFFPIAAIILVIGIAFIVLRSKSKKSHPMELHRLPRPLVSSHSYSRLFAPF